MLPLKPAFLIVTVVPFTEKSPLQPLVIEKPFGTVKLAVQPFTLFPELLVIVSSAVPHFFPFSSHEFPFFHENEKPLAETEEDCGPDELAGALEITGVFELDELLCAELELGLLLELEIFTELAVLLEFGTFIELAELPEPGSESAAALESGGISNPEELCKLLSFEVNDPAE